MKDVKVTVYKDIYTEQANHVSLCKVLERIKSGKDAELVGRIRSLTTKDEQNEVKLKLPAICFSGIIPSGKREDVRLQTHSNLVILDFDDLTPDVYAEKKRLFMAMPCVVAAFLSPRGNGLKVLIRIKDGNKHREHYRAIIKEFPGIDQKNINPSRVCFSSIDPEIYINYEATTYDKVAVEERVIYRAEGVTATEEERFKKLVKWMETKREFFVSGSRNDFIYKLAGACCRFGIDQKMAEELIHQEYLSTDPTFKVNEMTQAVRSAYKRNTFMSAEFSKNDFVDVRTQEVIKIDTESEFVADVIYGKDCIDEALKIYYFGYESAESTGIAEIDRIFKWKRGELTLLSGIGNHGKTLWLNYLMLNKSVKDGTKWAVFSPENFPAQEYYHDLTEMALGTTCNPFNPQRPDEATYRKAYEFVSEHFFYIYPKDLSPTPQYIKSRFLELIIKEKVSGCIIDPFNQMTNDYGITGGRDDKYLETFLADASRFAMTNHVFFVIVCHPHKLKKNERGGYDAPDVFDLAGGAMWNNKADNILVYHRPNRHNDPLDPTCEFHSKKIRRQKIVGEIGMESFHYNRNTHRFMFQDYPLKKFIEEFRNHGRLSTQSFDDSEKAPF